MKADIAFKLMKQKCKSFAIVLDEYGGVAGIVTIKDIIAQIVGDFETDADADAVPDIQKLSEHEYSIVGTTPLGDVQSELGIELPTDEYDTFGGYVFGIYGSIPDDGASIECTDRNLLIRSDEIDSHRLVCASVTITKNNTDDSNEE